MGSLILVFRWPLKRFRVVFQAKMYFLFYISSLKKVNLFERECEQGRRKSRGERKIKGRESLATLCAECEPSVGLATKFDLTALRS